MKILVCISCVPDTTTKITFTDNNTKFNSGGVQFVINPYDEFGLTKALMLKEANGGTVTVINVGGAENEPVIRKALAIGADDAVRVDTAATDAFAVANEIANYAKDQSYDLIIAGRESIDYNGGLVPGMLGELLGVTSVSPCIKLDISGTEATLDTIIEGGKQTFKAALPLVVGSQKGMVSENELRIPNMRGIMQARSKPLSVVPSSGATSTSNFNSFELPAAKADCKMISPDNVAELVELLHNEAKVI